MRISARNQFKGTVKKLTPGAVNGEVVIQIAPGIEVIAQITSESIRNLGLKEGATAWAVIKADNVMVGVEH